MNHSNCHPPSGTNHKTKSGSAVGMNLVHPGDYDPGSVV
jgi:hypothetical protein